MCSVWPNYMFISLLIYYWLSVSASKGHHQANIDTKLKMLVHIVKNVDFMGSHLHSLAFVIFYTTEYKWEPIKLMFLYYMHQHFKFCVNIGLMAAF